MSKPNAALIKQTVSAIHTKYAWPGGYPLFLITADGSALCCDCGKKEWNLLADAYRDNDRSGGWYVSAADIN